MNHLLDECVGSLEESLKERFEHDTKKLKDLKEVLKTKTMDPKYLGVPNICFSLTKPDDEREAEYSVQRKERGFDSSETWSLRDTIIDFVIPRLEVFISFHERTVIDEYGHVPKLKSILERFKAYKEDPDSYDEKLIENTTQAWHDFAELFFVLWW